MLFGEGLLVGKQEKMRIEIPSFVGQQESEIKDSGQCEIEKNYVFDSEAPRGRIVSQSPSSGSVRKVGRGERVRVEINVSLGKKADDMPDMVGNDSREALIEARMMGAEVEIVDDFDSSAKPDTVIRTSPWAGEHISEGDRVVLYVARKRARETVCVPDVLGLEHESACARLLAAGLCVGECGCGRVLSQSIAPNSIVLCGTEISLECTDENTNEENMTEDPDREDGIPREWWRIFGG